MTNAADAIQERGSITIRTFEKNGNVIVQIIDNGIGISEKMFSDLFEPSFTVNGSRMKVGLGLFTSADIMQKHQGRIEVESELGKGSTFSIIFSPKETRQIEVVERSQQADRCDRLDQGGK